MSTLVVSKAQSPPLQLEVSTPQGPELHLVLSDYKGFSYIGTCLHTGAGAAPGHIYITEAYASPEGVYTTGAVLHLDVSGHQEPMLFLDVFTMQRYELYM